MNPAKLLAITRAFLSQRALMNYLSKERVRDETASLFLSLHRGEIDIYVKRACASSRTKLA